MKNISEVLGTRGELYSCAECKAKYVVLPGVELRKPIVYKMGNSPRKQMKRQLGIGEQFDTCRQCRGHILEKENQSPEIRYCAWCGSPKVVVKTAGTTYVHVFELPTFDKLVEMRREAGELICSACGKAFRP